MGCMVLNTYLAINPEVVKKIAGVIYSAPLFGIADFANLDWGKKQAIKILANVMEDFIVNEALPLQMVTRNKPYIRL